MSRFHPVGRKTNTVAEHRESTEEAILNHRKVPSGVEEWMLKEGTRIISPNAQTIAIIVGNELLRLRDAENGGSCGGEYGFVTYKPSPVARHQNPWLSDGLTKNL